MVIVRMIWFIQALGGMLARYRGAIKMRLQYHSRYFSLLLKISYVPCPWSDIQAAPYSFVGSR